MPVFVKSFDTHVLDSKNFSSAGDIKIFLAQKDQLPLGTIELYHGDNLISNDCVISSLGEDATIDVSVPLLGGKTHGSLTRAGKVKNQTPKVAKMEKKKRPKGRAKRRWQYNRRFVAQAAATPGARKRGPNSNMKS